MCLRIILVLISVILSKFVLAKGNECINELPAQIGGQKPSASDENCYYYDGTLVVEGVFGIKSLEALRSQNIRHVILNSPGGSTSVALTAAEFIRRNNITTSVPEGSYCNSSCTLIFQSGIYRSAHETAKFHYHCVGVRFGAEVFQQNCGTDIENFSDECKKNLSEFSEIATIATEEFFKNYLTYDALDLFEVLMSQLDDVEWFKRGNFCKKSMTLTATETMSFNVVQELIK